MPRGIYKRTSKYKKECSKRMIGNKIHLGYKHSNKAKQAMSEKAKLRKPTFTGKKHTKETKEKMRKAKLENPTRYWLGKKRDKKMVEIIRAKNTKADDKIKYGTIHDRIRKKFGTPSYCEICKRSDKKKYEWSNKDHKYFLKKEDWQRLCTSCHHKYDSINNL